MSPDELTAENARLRRELQELRQTVSDPNTAPRLAAIIESSDDAIVSKSLEGTIRSWNGGAERIFGWTAEEAIGRPINIIIPPDRQEEEPAILARLQRGERVDHFQTVRIAKSGELRDISVSISPIRDGSGAIVGASKIARDITQQNRILRELREAKNLAERANQTKDRFLSNLSHELRTPLAPALAELGYLAETAELPESVRESMRMVRRNIETEARLVDDLLDLTRVEHGKMELNCSVVDVHEAIREAVASLQSQMDRKGLELTAGLRAAQHLVWADPDRLQQVFLNLLSNAVKFTPGQGAIAVRTANVSDGRGVRVEVSDNGRGIAPDMLPRLFQAFEQAEQSPRLGGLGLGLAITRSLVELHHGTVAASSPGLGRGASFTVELPVTEQRAPAKPPAAASEASRAAARLRVLLVEDHADTSLAMTRLLQAMGCDVQAAASVREAIEKGEGGGFDLLISDLGLPDGSGLEIMRRLRSSDLHGVALTGFGQEGDVRLTREAGFDSHMTKPVRFEALRDLVSSYAAAAALRQARG